MPTVLIGVTIYGPSVCEQASTHKSAHSLVNPKRSHMFHPPTTNCVDALSSKDSAPKLLIYELFYNIGQVTFIN